MDHFAMFSTVVASLLLIIAFINAEVCYDTGNFTVNSTYAKNRQFLLSSLASNVVANGGFYNTTFGDGTDKVYGLVLCISEPSSADCNKCVNYSIQGLMAACPVQKEAISWGGDPVPCIIRYSNRPLIGILELTPDDSGFNVGTISTNMEQFDQIWDSLMANLVAAASMVSSRFAAGTANLTTFQTIYALMQCTPDISQPIGAPV